MNVLVLVEEISREQNIHDMAWLLLISFVWFVLKRFESGAESHKNHEEEDVNLLKVVDKADAHKTLVIV